MIYKVQRTIIGSLLEGSATFSRPTNPGYVKITCGLQILGVEIYG